MHDTERLDDKLPPDPFLSIRDVLGVLSRRRATIVVTVVIMTSLAVAFGLWSGPRYTATALVMIKPQIIAGQRAPVASLLDTERDIIRSPLFVRTTMTDLALYDMTDFQVAPEDPASPSARAKAHLMAIWNQFGSEQEGTADQPVSPDETARATENRARERSESIFAENLSVGQSGESHVLRVNFTASAPELAASVANHIANLYVQRQVHEREAAAERAEKWLSTRVAKMREDVLEAERQLAELRVRNQFKFDRAAARSEGAVLYQELERQAEAKRAAYQAMLARYYDSRDRVESLTPDARLISRAQVPTAPSSISPALIGAVTLVISTVFGCGLALFREQMDTRIRGKDQIETTLRLPCLGLVPRMDDVPRHKRTAKHLVEVPRSLYSQAMRSLSLRIIAADPSPQVLLVTSALPGEGKSSLASSLAVALHQSGDSRVLLIDFDLWRPKIATTFGLPADAPGIASVLATRTTPDAAIVRQVETGIDILPAGPTRAAAGMPPRGAIADLLDGLRPNYDRMVIDAPSLLGIADARLLALCADSALLVARWGHTNLDVAGAGLALLRDIGVPILGAALTQVDPKRHARHGQDHDLQYYKRVRRYFAR